MNRTKSFEEMGREADRAVRDHTLARNYLSNHSEASASALLSVAIDRANWDNGTLALQAQLTAVVRERAGELLHEALGRLQDQGLAATTALRAAFDGRADALPEPDLSRQVPRADPAAEEAVQIERDRARTRLAEEEANAPLRAVLGASAPQVPAVAPQSGPGEAPLPGKAQSLQADGSNPYHTAWTALSREAQELLTWCMANPGSRFARTPSRDVLVAGGYLASTGAGANATWILTDEGLAVAGAQKP